MTNRIDDRCCGIFDLAAQAHTGLSYPEINMARNSDNRGLPLRIFAGAEHRGSATSETTSAVGAKSI
jgi:hypothetical protein